MMVLISVAIIMWCLPRHSATAHIHSSFPQCCLSMLGLSESLLEMCAARDRGSDRMLLRRTYSFFSPGCPTDDWLPGWRPIPSALGWRSAMHATAACDHSGVVLLGGCRIFIDCYRLAPTGLATSRRGFPRAYT